MVEGKERWAVVAFVIKGCERDLIFEGLVFLIAVTESEIFESMLIVALKTAI